MGCEIAVIPHLTFEERRSLAISQAVARRLLAEPAFVMSQARRNIERMRTAAAHEHAWIDIWEGLLGLGPESTAAILVSKDQLARDLRQSSPFAGVLTDSERAEAIRGVTR
jgi:hypothetical protein